MQYNFGAGLLVLIPSGSNPTPQQVGVLKDVSIDISITTKSLIGNQQFPVDVARASGKISGKAKSGQINGGLINSILTGSTKAAGSSIVVMNEAGTIPGTPFTVTVANGATFERDMGVIDLNTGLYMTRGATATGAGVYAVNTTTGAYTFNTADTGHKVAISYTYTSVSVGSTVTFTNQIMGSGTVYELNVFNTFRSKNIGWRFPASTFSKLAFAMKNEDYTEKDMDFECFADSAGNLLYEYFGE